MARTVNLREVAKPGNAAAAIGVELQGFTAGESIELRFFEDNTEDSLIPSTEPKANRKIGTIKGEVVQLAAKAGVAPLFSLSPKSVAADFTTSLKLVIAFSQPDGKILNSDLFLPADKVLLFEGDQWELFAEVAGELVQSPTTRLARVRRSLSVSKREATYQHYTGHFCRFHHDGSPNAVGTGGYFDDLLIGIKEAQDFIFIVDWSFQPHMRLSHSKPASRKDLSGTIGAILIEKAMNNPDMLIAIHTWDHTVILGQGAADDQNDDGDDHLDRIARHQFKLSRRPGNLLWRASSRTGTGFSHHQKFVVMDGRVSGLDRRILRAFIGGLDLTKGRFDFGNHPILPNDANSASFLDEILNEQGFDTVFDDWYNAEFFPNLDSVAKPAPVPRQPWHDIALHFTGPAAWDLVREFVGRWRLDPASLDFPTPSAAQGDTNAASIQRVVDRYIRMLQLLKNPKEKQHPVTNPRVFSQQWEPGGGPWATQVYRSIHRGHWEAGDRPVIIDMPDSRRREFVWTLRGDVEHSIQDAYRQAISQAVNFIYIETQYFISSGGKWDPRRTSITNSVAESLALKAIDAAQRKTPFHIYIVIPMFPEGSPSDGSNCSQRQFQWNTIRAMRKQIEDGSGKSAEELMSVFFLAKWHDLGGKLPDVSKERRANVVANRRYQIYVHSKFMLIDDRYLIIGSANLNERSLSGERDSEIAVGLWPNDDRTAQKCIEEARAFRKGIWSEHLGPAFPPADFDNPGSPACIKAVRDAAKENYAAFREGRRDDSKHGHLCLWPLAPVSSADPILSSTKAPEGDGLIPDRPANLTGDKLDEWRWHGPGSHFPFTSGSDIAE